MAWGAAILPVRVAGPDGWASSWAIVKGLAYAVGRGARVANLSFGQLAGSQIVLDAARSAVQDGMVVVASAGNCGCTESHPDSPWLLSVSATTSSDGLATFSSRGSFVDVAAPGQGVQTTSAGGGYGSVSGTSFSAPVVAGLVALIRSAEPSLTPAQVEGRLAASAVDRGPAGWDPSFGHGRVDAYAAVATYGSCGLGFELALLLPAVLALRRVRSSDGRRTTRREGRPAGR
jgi:subtilisin family serine protease